MINVLHIRSSSNLQESVTRKIGTLAVKHLKEQYSGVKVIERDLAVSSVPHVSPDFLKAMFSSGKEKGLELSNQLIDELFTSNVIVIEAPMYNFSIPSVLKAWIDHVVRVQKTFQYNVNNNETVTEGLLKNKQAILILGSGGVYSDGLLKAMDHQESYLRLILNFIGITDIVNIRIEGVSLGTERVAAAMEQAKQQVNMLTLRAA